MCILQEIFLDEELECLDWSDEVQFKHHFECYEESVNIEWENPRSPPNC